MNHPVTFAALWKQIKKLFVLWLILALVVAVAVMGIRFLSFTPRTTASATVNFGFAGIENGRDPDGNWFDVSVMKDPAVITAAAEAIGLSLAEGDAEKIASHLYISGYVPGNIVENITSLTSSYTSSTFSASSTKKVSAYYPTTYTLRLNFSPLGYSVETGNKLLRAMLSAYETTFYATYGYNTALEERLKGESYAEYDYSAAITVLKTNLGILSRYITELAAEDTEGFRSSTTGLTFQDLLSGVKTLISQDVKQLSSYVNSNNVSRDLVLQQNKYNYEIEAAQRDLKALEERIESLNEIIASYNKTKSVVLGASTTTTTTTTSTGTATEETAENGAGTEAVTGTASNAYEVTQKSVMYDFLVRRRVELRSQMADINASIVSYQALLTNMDKSFSEYAGVKVEEDFAAILDRAYQLIDNVRNTAEDFYSATKLKDAFRVVSVTEAENLPLRRLLTSSLPDILAAEAVLLGLFAFIVLLRAARDGKKEQTAALKAGQTA